MGDFWNQPYFNELFSFVCRLKHVQNLAQQNPELNLLPHDHDIIFRRFKRILQELFWGSKYQSLLPSVFEDEFSAPIKLLEDYRLTKITPVDNTFDLRQKFMITISTEPEATTKYVFLNEKFIFNHIFTNVDLFAN